MRQASDTLPLHAATCLEAAFRIIKQVYFELSRSQLSVKLGNCIDPPFEQIQPPFH